MAVYVNSGEKMQALIRYNGAFYAIDASEFVVTVDQCGRMTVRLEGHVDLTITWTTETPSDGPRELPAKQIQLGPVPPRLTAD